MSEQLMKMIPSRAGASKRGSTLAKGKKGPSYMIRLRVGNDRSPVDLDANQLDQAALSDVLEQVGSSSEAVGPLTLEANQVAHWPAEARMGLWRLWKGLRRAATGPLVLRVDKKEYQQPPDMALTDLIDLKAVPEARCRALELAAEILSGCYPAEDQAIHLTALMDRVREQGVSADRCQQLKVSLKQRLKEAGRNSLGGRARAGEGMASAFALAKLFLDQRYPLTGQLGIVESLADEFDEFDEFRNDRDMGTETTTPSYARRYYNENFYRRRPGVWVQASVDDLRMELTSFLQAAAPEKVSARFIADVLVNVKALCALHIDATPPLPFYLGLKRHLLALRNGLLDLDALARGRPPKLLPHDPNWFATTVLPYVFDPDADCPKFKAFLGQILNADPKTLKPKTQGDHRVKVIQEMAGYLFLTDNRFQKFFALVGSGWNGKGTLLDVLRHLIGPENTASVTLEGMGKEFGQESLVGKMLNLCGDMNEIDNAKEGTLKTWTGEDQVTVYRKYKPPLEIEPWLKFLFATNALPWFKDKTNGIWRRLVVIPFTFALQSDDDVDTTLRPKLRQELPGILNWALRGLARLLKQGRFTPCEVCTAAAEEHREECSPVREFIKNHFAFEAEHEGKKKGLTWMTTTTEVLRLVKKYQEDFGDRSISGHIVCRVLAGMPGVTVQRPKSLQGRKEFGKLYLGVCVGEPKQLSSHQADDIATKAGVNLPKRFLLDPQVVVAGPHGKPVTKKRPKKATKTKKQARKKARA